MKRKILILAYNPNHIDINTLGPMCTEIGVKFDAEVFTVPHHKIDEKPLYLVFNNFGVERGKEKHQETKGSVEIQMPVLRNRKPSKGLARR